MYKLIKEPSTGEINCVQRLSDTTFIPFALDNSDYQNFKAQINADEAQLQDADGNTMTAEQAKAYVATLP
jgi:hypothetical protein